MPDNSHATAEAGFLIYVRTVAGGVSPQVWHGLPNPHSDYWNNRRAGIERIAGKPQPLTAYQAGLPLDHLRLIYPPRAA